MLVIDASALVTFVVGGRWATAARGAVDDDYDWRAPEHLVVETLSAFRRAWIHRQLSDAAFHTAASRLERLEVTTYPVQRLIPQVLDMAANVSAYDAAYVALARQLDCPLLTLDLRLRRSVSGACELVPLRLAKD